MLDKKKLLNISQVTKMFNIQNTKKNKLPNHTLRFWETRFKQLKPTILNGGRRYYSEKDIKIIKMIIFLLKDQGLTINGAINIMNNKTKKLDATNTLSVKDIHYKSNIRLKSKRILEKIKKLNGKKNSY
jgi:DNA-binding transcriptional MerR regulator|tara:strand:- start:191 stop:577 length:387 start_codon:yes stop_codon:yes gene_type:complete